MKALIASLLTRYGCKTQVVFQNTAVSVSAFLQPITSKSWQNMERIIPTGGEVPHGQYLYIGPPDTDITLAEHIVSDGKIYLVRRADTIVFQDERLYVWGLCVEGGREDPWTN